MQDFFDQDSGRNYDSPMNERPEGAFILINGSYQRVEEGAPFLETSQQYARQAGFGKFRVFLNGVEKRPSNAPETIGSDDRIEIRPFDEAG